MYGAEIGGWRKHEKLEKIQEKYIKCIRLWLERKTLGYIAREEAGREKIKIRAGEEQERYESNG